MHVTYHALSTDEDSIGTGRAGIAYDGRRAIGTWSAVLHVELVAAGLNVRGSEREPVDAGDLEWLIREG